MGSYKEDVKSVYQPFPLKYILVVFFLFALSFVIGLYLVYSAVLFFLQNQSQTAIVAYIYSSEWLDGLALIASSAFIGSSSFIIYRLHGKASEHISMVKGLLGYFQFAGISEEASQLESIKVPSPLLLIALAVVFWYVPFLGFLTYVIFCYLLNRLIKILVSLEDVEDKIFSKAGIKLARSRTYRESLFLQAFLSAVTFGIFFLYVLYSAAGSFNEHLKQDYRLLSSIEL